MQVESEDGNTPSEFIRDLIRQDKECRLRNLEYELLEASRGAKVDLSVADIRKKGLLIILRERVRHR